MKKIIYVLALATGLTLASCGPQEIDDLFDDSAAVRLDKAKENYKTFFASNGGKWEMLYFANNKEQGYAFVMEFKDNGSVDITAANLYSTGSAATIMNEVSLWDVIADNGPVLTFNTYNKLLHVFSNPEDNPNTDANEQGEGHAGDYEFMIMSTTDNSAVLKGKKSSITIVMNRLDANMAAETYFTNLQERNKQEFSTLYSDLVLTTSNGKKYAVKINSAMMWSMYPVEGDAVTQTSSVNGILRPDGVRFMEPLTFLDDYTPGAAVVQEFTFQPDGSLLGDDGATKIEGLALIDIFQRQNLTFTIDKDNSAGELLEAYNSMVDGFKTTMKKTFQSGAFLYQKIVSSKTYNSFDFMFKASGNVSGHLFIKYVDNGDGTLSMTFDPEDANAFAANGKNYYNKTAELRAFMALITSKKFKLEAENSLNPNPIKLIDAGNEESYLTLKVTLTK